MIPRIPTSVIRGLQPAKAFHQSREEHRSTERKGEKENEVLDERNTAYFGSRAKHCADGNSCSVATEASKGKERRRVEDLPNERLSSWKLDVGEPIAELIK